MFSYIFAKVLENCRTTECYYDIVHNQRYEERACHLLSQLAVSGSNNIGREFNTKPPEYVYRTR